MILNWNLGRCPIIIKYHLYVSGVFEGGSGKVEDRREEEEPA